MISLSLMRTMTTGVVIVVVLLVYSWETADLWTTSLRRRPPQQEDSTKLPTLPAHEPIAILHIGPHKTATSTIQSFLKNALTRVYLQQDGFVYMDRHDEENPMPARLIHDLKYQQEELIFDDDDDDDDMVVFESIDWKPFANYVQTLANAEMNFLASDENLARSLTTAEHMKPLKQALRGYDNVRVVASYRRYTEWILSFYHEENRYHRHGPVPSFPEYFATSQTVSKEDSKIQARSSNDALFYPMNLMVWKNFTADFLVFNFHEHARHDLVPDFVCEVLSGAAATCGAAKAGLLAKSTDSNPSPSKSMFEGIRLTMGAISKEMFTLKMEDDDDWYNRDETLEPAFEKVAAFIDSRKDLPLPLICPTQGQLDMIYQRSVQLEAALVPDYHRRKGRDLLNESFHQAVSEHWYCNVDVDKALEAQVWQDFFKHLNEQVGR